MSVETVEPARAASSSLYFHPRETAERREEGEEGEDAESVSDGCRRVCSAGDVALFKHAASRVNREDKQGGG